MRMVSYAAVAVVGCILLGSPASAQVDPIEVELDEFWAEVSRTLAEGDHEAMIATFHPDGVHVGGTSDAYRTRRFSDNHAQLSAGNAETRSGAKTRASSFDSRRVFTTRTPRTKSASTDTG